MMAVSIAVAGCGSDGTNGTDGADGSDGQPGTNGTDGADGSDGQPGTDGTDGTDGSDGQPGTDGTDGRDFGEVADVSNDLTLELLVEMGEPLVAVITDVTVSSPPVVSFTVTTQNGTPVVGIDPPDIRGTFSKLIAADDTAGLRSHWVSYINSQETNDLIPPDDDPPAIPNPPGTRQATRETGTVVDNGDGTYVFTYTTDPTTSTDPAWEPDLTHRSGLEIRIDDAINPDNPTWDFVPDGSAVSDTKNIADTNLCNSCHQRLALHGDGRFTVEYCVTCHNDQTRDQGFGENLDMAHMVHAIHAAELREAQEQTEGEFAYKVLGRSVDDYSEVTYPRPLVDCAACHTASEDTPDGDDWQTSVESLPCGGCHVAGLTVGTPDATTGLSVYSYTHNPLGAGSFAGEQQDGACATQCHSSGIADKHVNLLAEAAKKFQYNIISVTDTDEGDNTVITFSVSDPTADPPTNYDVEAIGGPWDNPASRLAIVIAWSTDDYTNIDSGSGETNPIPPGSPANRPGSPAQVVSIDALNSGNTTNIGNNVFEVQSPVEVPAGLTGDSLAVGIEGHAGVDVGGDPEEEEIPVKGAVSFFTIGPDPDDNPTARRQVVDIDKCNDCHGSLSLHGNNRTDNIDLCVLCHNSNATDIRARQEAIEGTFGNPPPPPGAKHEESIDFKAMIHAIHNGEETGLIVYGFGGSVHDYGHVTFPGQINNCMGCHVEDAFYPTDDFRFATTTLSDPTMTVGRTPAREVALADQEDDVNTTPNAAACYSCHAVNVSHVVNNGGSFTATQDDDGTLNPLTFEDCTTCHGPDRVADVAEVHD
jgi:OmcA/MtrC family decaheme c-type cytochrome